jgi:hypothetical protein
MLGDDCWVPRDPNWTPFGRSFDAMMAEMKGEPVPEYNNLDIPVRPEPDPDIEPVPFETNKIAVILPVSEEVLYQQIDFNDLIKRAPARRCQRLAQETYWQNVPEWDNEVVERGYN